MTSCVSPHDQSGRDWSQQVAVHTSKYECQGTGGGLGLAMYLGLGTWGRRLDWLAVAKAQASSMPSAELGLNGPIEPAQREALDERELAPLLGDQKKKHGPDQLETPDAIFGSSPRLPECRMFSDSASCCIPTSSGLLDSYPRPRDTASDNRNHSQTIR